VGVYSGAVTTTAKKTKRSTQALFLSRGPAASYEPSKMNVRIVFWVSFLKACENIFFISMNHTIVYMDLSTVPTEAVPFVQSLVDRWQALALLGQEVNWWRKHKDGDGCSDDTFHDKTQVLIDRAVDCFSEKDTVPLGLLVTANTKRAQVIVSDSEDEEWLTSSRFA
jgi:hypothetical protein